MIKLCGLHSEFVSSLDCLLQMVGNLIKLNSICPALAVCDHVNLESSDSPYEREIFKPKPTQANNLFMSNFYNSKVIRHCRFVYICTLYTCYTTSKWCLLQCLCINNYKFCVQYYLLLLVITSVFMHFRLCMTSIKINPKKNHD